MSLTVNSDLPGIALTDEQQAIVAHDRGPALVFAVAGSGKTTSVEHRVERLVREGIFPAQRILVTTFNKKAAKEFEGRLKGKWPHCRKVNVHTLHSVGFGILRMAQRLGYLDNLQLSEGDGDTGGLDRRILYEALARARSEREGFADQLDTLDEEDFLNYVGLCKGNLRYADLPAERLPDEALKVATQAVPPEGITLAWYLDLYGMYERVRRERNYCTFDDMLMSGWEMLVRYPDVLREAQGRFDCVIVDEFQDVNLAQAEILDLLTRPHRNYMAIGDEDQTIYEWRGASPDFILAFSERYNASEYFIRDNFRCKASQVALANEVIRHNTKRREKFLSLTQGFGGDTLLHVEESDEAVGEEVVREIKDALREGYRPDDVAVLVRIYAQTAYIEANLIAESIPYKIVGGRPFYDRGEVRTLLGYLRLARLEQGLRQGQALNPAQVREFADLWKSLYNRPKRYLKRQLAEKIAQEVTYKDRPLVKVLALEAGMAEGGAAKELTKLAETLEWLSVSLDTLPANQLLTGLEARLGYAAFLRETSGFEATAREKIANVFALIHYAREKGTAAAFLGHIDRLKEIQIHEEDETELVTLMTVFRAKGLEWPIVFVPGCNDKLFPFGSTDRMEEERRLFYVALTRAKAYLHLYAVKSRALSPFLQEAGCMDLLHKVHDVKTALGRGPAEWRTEDALALARHLTPLSLRRYVENWWHGHTPEAQVRHVSQAMQRLCHVAGARGWGDSLGIHREEAELWEMFGPLESPPSEGDYPDLERFLVKPESIGQISSSRTGQSSSMDSGPVEVFRRGERVTHPVFGPGVVRQVSPGAGGTRLEVAFDDPGVGQKVLIQKFAKLSHLSS